MRCAPALLLVAGCNQIFGLEPTTTAECPHDLDCDGIADELDNCPQAANADQQDIDGDKLGDACDPCSWLADLASDDDGDTIASARDVCPAIGDPSQADADADGVGDACDPSPSSPNTLVCFADFATAAPSLAIWHVTGDWQLTSSKLSVPIEPGGMPRFLWATAPAFDTLTIESTLEAQIPLPTHAFELGVGMGDATALPGTRCVIRSVGSGASVALLDGAGVLGEQAVPGTFNPRLLRFTRAGGQLTCTISPITGSAVTVTGAAPPLALPFALALVSDSVRAAFDNVTFYR